MKGKKRKIVLSSVGMLLLAIIIGGGIYVSDYYHADEIAIEALRSDTVVTVKELQNDVFVFEPENPIAGFIFYPGGKVEYTAYAPLLRGLAEENILCILVKMPFNLAVLNMNAADGIPEQYKEIEKWYIGGHSLGGSMAASYVAEHTDRYEGLVLLASYAATDLSDTELKIISLYGSEDKVLNMEKYEQYDDYLVDDVEEIVIEGGCHAYFGNYGEQDGDGKATITPEQQVDSTIQCLIEFFKE